MNLLQNSTKNNNQTQQDVFRPLLELLEHKDRTFSSGNGSIRGQMQGNMMATGNPSYGIKNMMQAVEKLDPAFMGRCILYDQLDSHIEYINDNKKKVKKEYENEEDAFPDFDADFVSLVDTLREDIRVDVDYDRVEQIHDDVKRMVPADFVRLYEGRYDHHIQNVVAGLAKANTLIEDRDEFEVREKDYESARHIFEMIVGSWSSSVDLDEMTLPSRVHYLPDEERKLYEQIREEPGSTTEDLETDARSLSMKLNILLKADVIVKVEGGYYPYWHDIAAENGGEKFESVVAE
ncbi:MAG: hypothetical protein SVV03_02675 [Candidatus Nanohaloarchaea archaeon]|nr:hypothetical protein [Candidatus Nanohaloarchaea archaeon]